MAKIIRTICLFRKNVSAQTIVELKKIKESFEQQGFIVQTIRICSPSKNFTDLENRINDPQILLNVGQINFSTALSQLTNFFQTKNVSFNTEMTNEKIELKQVSLLQEIINQAPEKTFNFAYTFNNVKSSPYFPSADYEQDGFAVGLQPTDLASKANSLSDWFAEMTKVWDEIVQLGRTLPDFLGIDSSVAPLFKGESSLINFIKKIGLNFSDSTLTNTYMQITKFIKEANPQPVGLNGLMFPALEDFELASEYEQGNFSLERNVFLSLHSGLGVDTYPVGIDESAEKIKNLLQVVQGLSNKYHKPLSVRLVSDGRAKIGEMTNFHNQYLKDVIIRPL